MKGTDLLSVDGLHVREGERKEFRDDTRTLDPILGGQNAACSEEAILGALWLRPLTALPKD